MSLLKLIHLQARVVNSLVYRAAICVSYCTGLTAYEHAYVKARAFYRPDIVHAHDLPMLEIGARIKASTGALLVYDMHEFYPAQGSLTREQQRQLSAVESKHIRAATGLLPLTR